MKQLFSWTGMNLAVHTFVKARLIFQQEKPERSKYVGLLQPLPILEGAWQTVSMGFVEGLPKSGQANCILVVVEKFTRYGHFLPLKHPYTASSVAKLYLDRIYKLHGMPLAIISDSDRIFPRRFWQELFSLAQVQLRMSTSYHSQSDGQTERVNQCLETFLRCFMNACPKKWLGWLSLAEFWYDTSYHSSLGISSF
jgi:hypothetical protein